MIKELKNTKFCISEGIGFTLIELMVVISIIAILATIGFITYIQILKNGRDSKRHADLEQIQSALEQYRADQGFYPTSLLPPTGSLTSSTSIGSGTSPSNQKTYLNSMPFDPTNSSPYVYQYAAVPSLCDNSTNNQCSSYCLWDTVENSSNESTSTPSQCTSVKSGTNPLFVTPP